MKLEIIVQDDTTIRVKREHGAEVTGAIREDLLRMKTIQLLRSLLEAGRLTEFEGLRILGSHLYKLIFVDDVAAVFETALREAKEAKKKGDDKLRVRFTFQKNAAKLANLPWEFLYRPDEETITGYFLAAETKLTLFRFMPRSFQEEMHPYKEALRVLVAFGEPPNPPPGSTVNSNKDAIKADMNEFFTRLGVKSEFLDEATFESLPKKIDSFRPHVLHYIGHGLMGRRDANGLVNDSRIGLLNDQSGLFFCRDSQFVNYLGQKENRNLRLVVLQLNDCKHTEQSAFADYSTSFAGMAPALIQADIPAVVLMQFPVFYKLAKKFNDSFYSQLAEGNDIDLAVQEGRKKIYDDPDYFETPIFGTPVLYVVREDGIVEPGKTKSGQSESREQVSTFAGQKKTPDQADTEQKKSVTKGAKTAVDAGYLWKRGTQKADEMGLVPQQLNSLGTIYSSLFQEKISGNGNYRQVLESAMATNTDLDIQKVIAEMLNELEA